MTLNYQSRIFLINYDEFLGSMGDTKLSLERRTYKYFGIEVGFNRKSTNLEIRESDLLTKYTNNANGWLVNILWYF